MPRLSLWNSGRKGSDYAFVDRIVSEFFGASGTAVHAHLYLGPHDQTGPAALAPPGAPAERSIQDALFLENRDRKYSGTVFELRGSCTVQDSDFDLRQPGLSAQNDTLVIEFHLNDLLALLGRKLMPGDVLELPHQRDDALLDAAAPAINKFYVVDDASRASDGYSSSWFPHIWRVKASPMANAQEYADILDKPATDPFGYRTDSSLAGLLDTGLDLEINQGVVEQAKASVPRRNFETRQFHVVPGDEEAGQTPWIYAGDGVPPNGARLAGSGHRYPEAPAEGDYFLRTDCTPAALFRFKSGRWRVQEVDHRQEWNAAHRVLEGFINNTATARFDDGTDAPSKLALSGTVKPRADF